MKSKNHRIGEACSGDIDKRGRALNHNKNRPNNTTNKAAKKRNYSAKRKKNFAK